MQRHIIRIAALMTSVANFAVFVGAFIFLAWLFAQDIHLELPLPGWLLAFGVVSMLKLSVYGTFRGIAEVLDESKVAKHNL